MKFYQSMFDSLTNFIPATWTLNVLASGIEEITSTANLSLTLSSQTVSNPPYTIQSLTYRICNNDLKLTFNNLNSEEKRKKNEIWIMGHK